MRLVAALLAAICVFTLSGCDYGRFDIKNRLVIEGVGVDFDAFAEEYVITALTLGASAQSEQGDSPKAQTTLFTARGATVSGALDSLSEITGRTPMYSQNRVIILGFDMPAERKRAALDNFLREYTARSDVLVCVCVSSAADALAAKGVGNVAAETIEKALEVCRSRSCCVDAQLYKTVNLIMESGDNAVLPLVQVSEDSVEDTPAVRVAGSVALGGDDCVLSLRETQALMLILGEAEQGELEVLSDGASAGLNMVKIGTKTELYSENGKMKINIKIECTADLVEYGDGKFSALGKDALGNIEAAAQSEIERECSELIARLIPDGHDIFRFSRRIELFDGCTPERAREYALSAEYGVGASVKIRKIGQEAVS